jgi:hypothetical protein
MGGYLSVVSYERAGFTAIPYEVPFDAGKGDLIFEV